MLPTRERRNLDNLTAAADSERSAEDADSGAEPPRLRRQLVGGYRTADVEALLAAHQEEIEELRRDIAALWLAFGQHERAVRSLEASVQPPNRSEPPSSEDSGAGPSPEAVEQKKPPALPARAVDDQLAELDEVLAAIEQATRTLERTYAEAIEGPGLDERAAEEEQ